MNACVRVRVSACACECVCVCVKGRGRCTRREFQQKSLQDFLRTPSQSQLERKTIVKIEGLLTSLFQPIHTEG